MSDAAEPVAPSPSAAASAPFASERRHRDWIGSSLGLLVFLGGVALLVLTFRLAYGMFQTPPTVALDLQGGKTIDLGRASDRASAILVRVVVLVLMAFTGSLVANRGILLYSRCDGR